VVSRSKRCTYEPYGRIQDLEVAASVCYTSASKQVGVQWVLEAAFLRHDKALALLLVLCG